MVSHRIVLRNRNIHIHNQYKKRKKIKKIFAILILVLFLTAGCVRRDLHPVKPVIPEEQPVIEGCTEDSDCQIGGCNREICAEADFVKNIASICIYKPEFECYKMIECKCLNSRCAWDKTEEFMSCFEKKTAMK